MEGRFTEMKELVKPLTSDAEAFRREHEVLKQGNDELEGGT